MTDCVDHGRRGFGLGYATAWVTRAGVRKTTTLHRKVHFEATGEWPEVVRHTCDNARCINPAHLVGGTQQQNVQDMLRRGRMGDVGNPGEANGRCILTDAQCEEVRRLYIPNSKIRGIPALSRIYGVGTTQLWRILRGGKRA